VCNELNADALGVLLAAPVGTSIKVASARSQVGKNVREAELSALLDRACNRAGDKNFLATLRVLLRAGAAPYPSTLDELCSLEPVPTEAVIAILEAPSISSYARLQASFLLRRISLNAHDNKQDKLTSRLIRLLRDSAAAGLPLPI